MKIVKLTSSFNTSKLDKILSDRSLQDEKERQKLLQKVMQWLDSHGSQHGIQTAYIFGSLTQPQRFHQNSDIDIAVEQINPEDFFAVISLIYEALGRDVDVIEVNKCHFGDRIKQKGIRWTATNLSF